ncbi:hypothetical protein SprV_0602174300 [Sparganum proliferum]
MVNVHRQSLSHFADIILHITNLLSGPQNVRPTCLQTPPVVIDKVKAALADATLLNHSAPDAPISIVVNASSIAVGALSPDIDLAEMAVGQRRAGSSCDVDVSGLQLQDLPLTTGNATILCDTSTTSDSPFVPPSLSECLSSDEDVRHPTRNLQGRHDHGPPQNYSPGHCWTSPVVPHPLLLHLPSSLFFRPVYSDFHHVRDLQLPPPHQPPVLQQLHALTLPLYLLYISPTVDVMFTSLTI